MKSNFAASTADLPPAPRLFVNDLNKAKKQQPFPCIVVMGCCFFTVQLFIYLLWRSGMIVARDLLGRRDIIS